jgi:shikimate kinase
MCHISNQSNLYYKITKNYHGTENPECVTLSVHKEAPAGTYLASSSRLITALVATYKRQA